MRDENEEALLEELAADIRRRQRYSRGPQKLATAINGLMARSGFAQQQSGQQFLEAWRTVAGDALARHSRPGNLRRGVLAVTVRNAAVTQELMFRKQELLKRPNQRMPDARIRDLHFRVGAIG